LVNRSNLRSGTPAAISQFCGLDVIVAIRHQKWQCRELIHNISAGLWPRKALRQFLEDQPGRNERLADFDRVRQRLHFRSRRG
jgi:hypothetical protein